MRSEILLQLVFVLLNLLLTRNQLLLCLAVLSLGIFEFFLEVVLFQLHFLQLLLVLHISRVMLWSLLLIFHIRILERGSEVMLNGHVFGEGLLGLHEAALKFLYFLLL